MTPRLLWITHTYNQHADNKPFSRILTCGQPQFPDYFQLEKSVLAQQKYDNFHGKINTSYVSGYPYFWAELLRSRDIYILDPYFSGTELEHLITYLNRPIAKTLPRNILSKLVIFTCDNSIGRSRYTLCKNLYARHEKLFLKQGINVSIEKFKDATKPQLEHFYTHDRIVLMDDNIWHFGATVGGLYFDGGLTAVSGPWPDVDGKMMDFMNQLLENHTPGVTDGTRSSVEKPVP